VGNLHNPRTPQKLKGRGKKKYHRRIEAGGGRSLVNGKKRKGGNRSGAVPASR